MRERRKYDCVEVDGRDRRGGTKSDREGEKGRGLLFPGHNGGGETLCEAPSRQSAALPSDTL